MQTKILKYTAGVSLAEAAEVLENGGLVAFATETVYGLGGNALDENAAKISALKAHYLEQVEKRVPHIRINRLGLLRKTSKCASKMYTSTMIDPLTS